MSRRKKAGAGLLVLLLVVTLLATLGGPSTRQSVSPQAGGGTTSSGATGATAGEGAAQLAGDNAGAPPAGKSGAAPAQGGTGAAPGQGRTSTEYDRKVIRTASLSMKVEDVSAAVQRAQAVASGLGGWVLTSSTRQEGEYTIAEATLVVPAAAFGDAVNQMRSMAKETVSDVVQGQDVTAEYVDLKARQRALEASEASLLELMSKATSVGDVVTVRRELTAVQSELEQVKGRAQYLSQRSDMSQISLRLSPYIVEKTAPRLEPGWDPVRVIERAWAASLAVLQQVATILLSVLVFSWWLFPLAGAVLVWRRRASARSHAESV